MIYLDDLTEWSPQMRPVFDDARRVRVHKDVMALAYSLAIDAKKLEAASRFIFFPSEKTWIEWEDDQGKMGMFFEGHQASVTEGLGFWAHSRHGTDPQVVPCFVDTPRYALAFKPEQHRQLLLKKAEGNVGATNKVRDAFKDMTFESQMKIQGSFDTVKPVIWAVLALINSPKIIRQHPIDQSKLNKRRQALGRYTFHPHHEVRLNVDKHIIDTASGETDGASRCLHFVRAFLRFRLGQYELVRPHWRGDPALGIRDTHYAVDRQNSKWKD